MFSSCLKVDFWVSLPYFKGRNQPGGIVGDCLTKDASENLPVNHIIFTIQMSILVVFFRHTQVVTHASYGCLQIPLYRVPITILQWYKNNYNNYNSKNRVNCRNNPLLSIFYWSMSYSHSIFGTMYSPHFTWDPHLQPRQQLHMSLCLKWPYLNPFTSTTSIIQLSPMAHDT